MLKAWRGNKQKPARTRIMPDGVVLFLYPQTRGHGMSVTTELPPVLNATTLCDRCSGRAYVVVILRWSPNLRNGGELLMCSHHYRKHEAALAPFVAQLIDEREQLNEHIRDDKHVS